MDSQGQARDGSLGASLKATYRALLARGLATGEAANLTAFLHGLPSAGFQWTLPEIEGILQGRIRHAAEERAAARALLPPRTPLRHDRSTVHDRRSRGGRSTHVIDPPTA